MENENEIERFDPSALMNGVRDRIKATFVSLIPDQHWGKLVQGEIDSFFSKKDGYNRERSSDFSLLIKSELEKYVKEKIVPPIMNQYFEQEWDGEKNEVKVGKVVEDIIIKNSGQILLTIIGSAMQNAINNAQNAQNF